ncbi:flavin-containing monooxygenase [Nocardia asteroides]|uniref:flavin-containing monooxygenase n=1 Tax=Nocardia asteroides TaxID=1824 RepID=UPI0037C9B529
MSSSLHSAEQLDVVVIGAGLSGINAAYRLQEQCPGKSYAILEARESMGGTWDLFRYPGIRSDSDIFTFGFGFKPWRGDKPLAEGAEILSYLRETTAENDIDRHIRYGTKVIAADWSTAEQRWNLDLEVRTGDTVERRKLSARFVYLCSGYYRYDAGYTPEFPGLGDFAGQVVHPQFWPEELDYTDKRVVIIGSGATAVTLVPAMAPAAGHVTMLQRSPSWIGAVPSRDKIADRLRAVLPAGLAHRLIRAKNITRGIAIYTYCRHNPQGARKALTELATKVLGGDAAAVAEHFTPSYDPWDQRLCAAPGGDFFKAIRGGDATVVTDRIDTFVPEGIRLVSGRVLEADLVVTATGLQLSAGGGIEFCLDGRRVDLSESFLWRGAMVSGVPNLAVCMGYINASWTLRADLSARLVCRVLRYLDTENASSVSPRTPEGMRRLPIIDLKSGYVQRSISEFPAQGPSGSWRVPQNYLIDRVATLRGGFGRDLELTTVTPRAEVLV